MTEYNIEVSDINFNWLYVDPFTNKILKCSKIEAQKLIFLMMDQTKLDYHIIEAKK